MKTWVLILVLGIVGLLAAEAGAQTAVPTNFPSANLNNPTIQELAAPKSDEGGFGNPTSGEQTTGTTNFPLGIPSQTPLGAPSIAAPPPNSTSANSFLGNQPGSSANPNTSTSQSVPSTITNFLFASSAQSSIGQGQSVFASPTNGYDVRLTQFAPNILQFTISPTNAVNTNWLVEFSSTNDFFTPGIYSNAVNAAGSPARLVFGGTGRVVNTSDGAFKVLEATYSSNQLVSFAADFVQFDNDDTNSWNEGSIRYNSTIPDTVHLFMAPVALTFQKGNAVVTWSTNLTGFQLEYATNVPANPWFTDNAVPAIVNGQFTVTDPISGGVHFYRLIKPL